MFSLQSLQEATQLASTPRPRSALIKITAVAAADSTSASSVRRAVADGTLPPPLKLSTKCTRWVASEVEAVLAARIAGKTADEIRLLVRQLVADRSKVSA